MLVYWKIVSDPTYNKIKEIQFIDNEGCFASQFTDKCKFESVEEAKKIVKYLIFT